MIVFVIAEDAMYKKAENNNSTRKCDAHSFDRSFWKRTIIQDNFFSLKKEREKKTTYLCIYQQSETLCTLC